MEKDRLAKEPGLLNDYAAAEVSRAVVELTKLFRYASGGTTTYFFEAAKNPLPLMTTGWAVDSSGNVTLRDVALTVNDDGYKEGNVGTVIGLVPSMNRVLWLMEWHGYEWEAVSIHEWPAGIVRMTAPGAGC